jgi:hypothetical protein
MAIRSMMHEIEPVWIVAAPGILLHLPEDLVRWSGGFLEKVCHKLNGNWYS